MPNSYRLSLAHINDTHSNFDPSPFKFRLKLNDQNYNVAVDTGGYARLSYQIEHARQQSKQQDIPFVFLHGGDSFQGTLYFREFKGAANAHLLNMLKPDAMVLGNHEIDAGNGPVLAFLNRIQFPLLAGNMDLNQEDPAKEAVLSNHPQLYDFDDVNQIAKVRLIPFYNTQLAIIGITLDQMPLIARPDPDTLWMNAIETTRKTVKSLHDQGIDHIIVLSHLGYEQDKELAASVNGISLIVGGHSHTLQGDLTSLGLSNMPYGESVNNTPILHAGKYAETLGFAEITFDEQGNVTRLNGSNYFMIGQDVTVTRNDGIKLQNDEHLSVIHYLKSHPNILGDEQNDEVSQVIATEYRPALVALEQQILANIPKDFVHTRLPSKEFPHGSEIAPWVSRSMYKAAQQFEPKLDFALHNAGGVRQSLNKGQLSAADVVGRILPFELPLVLYQIQGKFIISLLESTINAATNNGVMGTGAGSFPYPYGLKYSYDGKKPKGERISEVFVYREETWQILEAEQLYLGVSSAYTATGREGYTDILHALWQTPLPNCSLAEAFIDFIDRYGYKIGMQQIHNIQYRPK